jgi:hypothetical protein
MTSPPQQALGQSHELLLYRIDEQHSLVLVERVDHRADVHRR